MVLANRNNHWFFSARLISNWTKSTLKNVSKSFEKNLNGPTCSTGLFGYSMITEPKGFDVATARSLKECAKIYEKILSKTNNNKKKVQLVDDLSNEICILADMAECVRLLHPQVSWKSTAYECMAKMSEYVEQLNTDLNLYNELRIYIESNPELDPIDRRVGGLLLKEFEISGATLQSEKKDQFIKSASIIFREGAAFVAGLQNPTRLIASELKSNPKAKNFLKQDDDTYLLMHPNFGHPETETRRQCYTLFYKRNAGQENHMAQILQHRTILAQITGYRNSVDRASYQMMLNSSDKIGNFLTELAERNKENVKFESEKAKHLLKQKDLHVADIPYVTQFARNKLSENAIMLKFPVNTIVEAYNVFVRSLFNVEFRQVDDNELLWHSSVQKYEVYDLTDDHICGHTYIDLFSRPNKEGGDCHMTVRCHKQLTGNKRQLPIVVLSLSIPEHSTCLSIYELENIWHELGHSLHSMLGTTKHQHVSGTRCSADWAEVPSTLSEIAMYTPDVFSQCYPTADESAIKTFSAARNAFRAIELQTQIVHALFDLHAHSMTKIDIESLVVKFAELERNYLPELVSSQMTFWPCRFGHLVPYGGKYSAYLVSHACAHLIWQEIFIKNPLSRNAGTKWRQAQSYGGERSIESLVTELLNRHLQPTDLIETLVKEAESSLQLLDRI